MKIRFIFFFLFFIKLYAIDGVLLNDGFVLNSNVVGKINVISQEVYEKTGVFLGVSVSDIGFKQNLDSMRQNISQYGNYAIILLDIKDKKIDILNSDNMEKVIDKRKLLNFYYLKWGFFPTQGAILPLISSPKSQDPYNTAILNGFDEMACEVSKHFNVHFDSVFYDVNNNLFGAIRGIFYCFIIFVLFIMIKNKFKSKVVK